MENIKRILDCLEDGERGVSLEIQLKSDEVGAWTLHTYYADSFGHSCMWKAASLKELDAAVADHPEGNA